jgi:GntR family transcriptional repressor for pyruvate dehydrogenase complex
MSDGVSNHMPSDSLTVRVTEHIFDHIRQNGLSTGDTLPSEMRTSTDLKISRGIVREAFRSLEVAGIIEKGNGRSPKVGVLNGSFLTHLMLHALTTSQISIKQVLEIRTLLEVPAAQMAAKRRTRSDVARLRSAVTGMKRSVGKPDKFVQHDLEFHSVINGATGNPLIDVMCGAMQECMQQSMRIGITNRRAKADVLKVVETHDLIATAIDEGSSPRAGTLMKKHFEDARLAIALSGID